MDKYNTDNMGFDNDHNHVVHLYTYTWDDWIMNDIGIFSNIYCQVNLRVVIMKSWMSCMETSRIYSKYVNIKKILR